MSIDLNNFDLSVYKSLFTDARKDLTFLARTAEAAERYDDMCRCMKELVHLEKEPVGLSVDERNLLSVAYKNVIGARRASWRTLNAESQDEKNSNLIVNYKQSVEQELKQICDDVLSLLEVLRNQETIDKITDSSANGDGEKPTVKSSPEGEAQVFYLKMTGDYYRYLAEAVTDKNHEQQAADYYKQAFSLAQCVLEPTHPIRLGLALNYSVCFYEILKNKEKACELAKDAFDDAISKLDKLEEADYKDSTLIMQLLRDNLTLWTSTEDDGDDNNDNVYDGKLTNN